MELNALFPLTLAAINQPFSKAIDNGKMDDSRGMLLKNLNEVFEQDPVCKDPQVHSNHIN